MGWRETLNFRATSLLQNAKLEDEMDQEMRAHFDQLVDDFKSEGHGDEQARRLARREFGSVDHAKEECRDSWGTRLVFDFWRDVRFGARQLGKSKGFTLVSVLTLGLAIGACATIYSAFDAALFRPLPYEHPEQIVSVLEYSDRGDTNASGGAFKDWQDNSKSYESMVLHSTVVRNLETDQGPIRLFGCEVTSGFLDTIGVAPLRGRGFLPTESSVGGNNRVVMLTEESWSERYGRDESILGQTIQLDAAPFEVIGILPAGAWTERREEFFIPAVIFEWQTWRSSRENHWAKVWVRLKPSVTPAAFEEELNTIKKNLNSAYPQFKHDWTVAVYPLQEKLSESPLHILLVLGGAVAVVLLIACANVANLLLARSAKRKREIALRSSLGASGRRITRQVLTESFLLAALGGVLGIAISLGGIELLQVLTTDLLPSNMAPQLDARVLTAAIVLTCGTAMLFGWLPAWNSNKIELNASLKTGDKSSSSRTLSQSILVIGEVALTVALLACAGLLLRSLLNVIHEDPGFDPSNAITFDLSLPQETYGGPEKRVVFIKSVLDGLGSLPGIKSVGSCSKSILTNNTQASFASRQDRPESRNDYIANIQHAGGEYFKAMGAQLISGRFLNQLDNSLEAAPAVVIDQRIANELFPDEEPIGQFLNTWNAPWEIVGVIENMKLTNDSREGTVFMPHVGYPFEISVVIRTETDPSAIIEMAKRQIAKIDSNIGLANIRTLQEALGQSYSQRKIVLNLMGGFAAVATLLACIGLYGVMSYTVTGRRREWSIRRALGATSQEILKQVVLDGTKLILIGLFVGTVAAVMASKMLATQLYQVSGYDVSIFAATNAIIAIVGILSCWLPASHATRFDPSSALRAE